MTFEERVVHLVTHCAGRHTPPRKADRDPTSCAIRHVAAWLLVHGGHRKLHASAHDAINRIEYEAEHGRGWALDLLLLAIGQIVEAEHGKARRAPRRLPVRQVVHTPARRVDPPQVVHTCATPFDRATCPQERPCPRRECRYHLPVTGECALDCAELGGMEQVQIAIHLGVTRSQVWNDEQRALAKLRKRHGRALVEWLVSDGPKSRGGWNT